MKTSRVPGFYNMSVTERRELIANMHDLSDGEAKDLFSDQALLADTADKMIENVVGTYSLPLGLGLNFLINEKEYVVPMAIEEASVVASASYIAKIVRSAGGFQTEATDQVMIGQIQVVGCSDIPAAKERIMQEKQSLIEEANQAYPSIVARGGGAEEIGRASCRERE